MTPLRGARAVVTIATLLVFVFALWPVDRVTLEAEGEVVRVVTVPRGAELYLDYQHSVIRAPVREAFVVSRPGGLVLIRTEHGAFGAGLPTENFGEFRHDGDVYVNSGIERLVPDLFLRISDGSIQTLTVEDGEKVYFRDFFEPGSVIRVRARTLPRAGAVFL